MLREFDQVFSKPVLFTWGKEYYFPLQGAFINFSRYFLLSQPEETCCQNLAGRG